MSSVDWLVISQSDLESDEATGGFIRAYCHIHGSDKQRSLSINAENGFGSCHACGARVLVRELNPDAAANIERGQGRVYAGDIKVRDAKYIARAARAPKQPAPRSIERWQREEIDILRSLYDSMTARLADERASAYIKGRGLKHETAADAGLGYIPDVPLTGKYKPIAKWADHIIIPVYSPSDGRQFAGRCLKHWQPVSFLR
jgi:DNA primase